MRKALSGIEQARSVVEKFYGKEVSIKHNKGRNRICHYKGMITQVYDNIFIVTIHNEIFDRLSCTYSDIVCGEIAFKEI